MEQFFEDLKEALEIEDRSISPEDIFRDYEEWDSLAYLTVLAMINDDYDLVISRNIFDGFTTVKDIYDYIEGNK